MLNTLLTIDTWVRSNCTIGIVHLNKKPVCFSLELPWNNNEPNISCIPAGIYHASKYDSPSKGDVILLHKVYERSWIEIHAGNYTYQIEGCILVGDGICFLDNDSIPDVKNSKFTLEHLLMQLPYDFDVAIHRHF